MCRVPSGLVNRSFTLGCSLKAKWLGITLQGGLGAAAASERRVLGMPWAAGGAQRSYGHHLHPIQLGFHGNSLFFSVCMWMCGGFAPCGPSALLVTKCLTRKRNVFVNPLIMGQETIYCGIFKNHQFLIFVTFYGSKGGILGQKTVFWGVVTGCEVKRPAAKTENNLNGPQKQDPIVGITHR